MPEQAVLTTDGVGLKVNLTAVYEISNPAMAINLSYRLGLKIILKI
ncbi:hypothetical protein [Adonisia turfae]|nr:hypothetical protein [Adonisia turfae]